MLRFPNPSSTIHNFVNVYRVAHQELDGKVVTIDDLVEAVVGENLATSSGYTGDRAIDRSTRADRSRDPLYNQIKMYAELFRSLGWLHPTPEAALRYSFTPLGTQVVLSGPHYAEIVGESALGIAYPSHTLSGQLGDHRIRPFCFLLRTMLESNGALTRDEMIVGPLSAKSDRLTNASTQVSTRILNLRKDSAKVVAALDRLSRQRGVKINTLRNYTRWPIALMRDLGWIEKSRQSVYELTNHGHQVANRASIAADLRADDLSTLRPSELKALSLFAHFGMLNRAGFDTSSVNHLLDTSDPALARAMRALTIRPEQELLYSPFQTLTILDTQTIFESPSSAEVIQIHRQARAVEHDAKRPRSGMQLEFSAGATSAVTVDTAPTELIDELKAASSGDLPEREAARRFASWHQSDGQRVFYPLVRDMFRLLGLRCETSRRGVNYERWDACLWVGRLAVPIEIKSPTEEEAVSTKALRQAVENKIVLLARSSRKTSVEAVSLIVGFKSPNERSDVLLLVDEVFETYGIRVGIVDLQTLAVACIRRVREKQRARMDGIVGLKGILHV